MDHRDRLATVTAIAQGMLSNPAGYTTSDEYAGMHWHDAIANEAADIADALIRVAESPRGYKLNRS